MTWLLLNAFERDKFKKELVSLQAEFQGTVESPEIARLENKMIFTKSKVWPLQHSLGEKTKFRALYVRLCGLHNSWLIGTLGITLHVLSHVILIITL